jgi:hypothetical protein
MRFEGDEAPDEEMCQPDELKQLNSSNLGRRVNSSASNINSLVSNRGFL